MRASARCPPAWPAPWSGLPLALVSAAMCSISAAIPLGFASWVVKRSDVALTSGILIAVGAALLLAAGGKEAKVSGQSLILSYGLLKRVVRLPDVVELADVGELSGFVLARRLPGLALSTAVSTLSGWAALWWSLAQVWASPLTLPASLAGALSLQYAMLITLISPSGGRRLDFGHALGISAGLIALLASADAPAGVDKILVVLGCAGLLFSAAFAIAPRRMRDLLLIRLADGSVYVIVMRGETVSELRDALVRALGGAEGEV
ncbi:MAG: hypothetical protein QI223_08440 [Candidatus Korarchaeota archaeon]|nr:hypothetical protein [Candidatus Korarchaeota archaeon]